MMKHWDAIRDILHTNGCWISTVDGGGKVVQSISEIEQYLDGIDGEPIEVTPYDTIIERLNAIDNAITLHLNWHLIADKEGKP